MSWEAVSAIATAFTGIVIALTVVIGARQARGALEQIKETHRATQLDGMLRIFQLLDDERFTKARLCSKRANRSPKTTGLCGILAYYCVVGVSIGLCARHARAHRRLRKNGSFRRRAFLLPLGKHDPGHLERIRPVVELLREIADNPYLYKDTEWLAADTARWARKFMAENPRVRPSTGEPFTLEAFETGSR